MYDVWKTALWIDGICFQIHQARHKWTIKWMPNRHNWSPVLDTKWHVSNSTNLWVLTKWQSCDSFCLNQSEPVGIQWFCCALILGTGWHAKSRWHVHPLPYGKYELLNCWMCHCSANMIALFSIGFTFSSIVLPCHFCRLFLFVFFLVEISTTDRQVEPRTRLF